MLNVFQSTRSSGTATDHARTPHRHRKISIHAVLWDRDRIGNHPRRVRGDFNPRGPLGPRLTSRSSSSQRSRFQSTRSSGTATRTHGDTVPARRISIHAVLWDRDIRCECASPNSSDFNPRGPLGPRRHDGGHPRLLWLISIHAVLWDRDFFTFSLLSLK